MANPEHLAILERGVPVWNAWLNDNPDVKPDLSGADLSGKDLHGIHLREANLTSVNLSRASLSYAELNEARLFRADLSKADLSNAGLIGADFTEAKLGGAMLVGANSMSTKFDEAELDFADFSNAALVGSTFRHAILSDANFSSANMNSVNLGHSLLLDTNFGGAYFEETDFSEAHLSGTRFADVDLSSAIGLGAVIHSGPSTVGTDTLYKSHGDISEDFLREAGVTEAVVDLARSIRLGPPIQWHSCFISYSTKDEEFARRLHSRMRQAHMRVWFAPEDLKGGKKLHEQLFEAIQIHDRLLLVLSEHSIQSEWVMSEIRKAREAEKKEKRRKLFPIRLTDFETLRDWTCFDADTGKDLAVEVREYFIPDFSNWKNHDAFETAFSRLQADLKAETKPKHV